MDNKIVINPYKKQKEEEKEKEKEVQKKINEQINMSKNKKKLKKKKMKEKTDEKYNEFNILYDFQILIKKIFKKKDYVFCTRYKYK